VSTPGVIHNNNDAGIYRCNLSRITRYANGTLNPITGDRTYDATGNMVTVSTSCCDQLLDTFTVSTQFAYPTSRRRGAVSGDANATVTSGAAYDFNTGLPTSSTDANNQTTQLEYYPGSLRLKKLTLPTLGTTGFDVSFR
jgi:hypothetical protein